jgi:hypothetical protein
MGEVTRSWSAQGPSPSYPYCARDPLPLQLPRQDSKLNGWRMAPVIAPGAPLPEAKKSVALARRVAAGDLTIPARGAKGRARLRPKALWLDGVGVTSWTERNFECGRCQAPGGHANTYMLYVCKRRRA